MIKRWPVHGKGTCGHPLPVDIVIHVLTLGPDPNAIDRAGSSLDEFANLHSFRVAIDEPCVLECADHTIHARDSGKSYEVLTTTADAKHETIVEGGMATEHNPRCVSRNTLVSIKHHDIGIEIVRVDERPIPGPTIARSKRNVVTTVSIPGRRGPCCASRKFTFCPVEGFAIVSGSPTICWIVGSSNQAAFNRFVFRRRGFLRLGRVRGNLRRWWRRLRRRRGRGLSRRLFL